MLLKGVRVLNQGNKGVVAVKIKGPIIEEISASTSSFDSKAIHFEKALLLPGLVNSHDHLCFNLYPRLGGTNYSDYREWALDVQTHYKADIRKLEKVPRPLLYQWGILKNLVNGVTTVVQHGAFFQTDFDHLVRVHRQTVPLHSTSFERKWKWKLLRPSPHPVVMHAGEGLNEDMEKELRQLGRWNVFRNKIIPVHGIKMTPGLAPDFKALIWCPESNFELFQATAAVRSLWDQIPILFGSDSTISASWNMWRHFRRAFKLELLQPDQLLSTLTSNPAKIWNLDKKGEVKEGFFADLTIVDHPGDDPWATFCGAQPTAVLLVVKEGKVVLCDDRIWPQINRINQKHDHFTRLRIGDTYKWIAADVNELMQNIKALAPEVAFPFGI